VSQSEPMEGPERATVLVVDDDEDIRFLLRVAVGRGCYRVMEARDGDEALDLIGRARPALILLDVNMPGLGGTELCRRLKSDPVRRSIKVVMVTADSNDDERRRALAAGPDGYVTKPFSPQLLLDRVDAELR
jgi:two-component system OmpR family response regulator